MSFLVSRKIANEELTIETGKLAFQSDSSVVIKHGESVLLVSVCYSKEPKLDLDFLPLTVDYEERQYAAGKIPGGFFRREGRPGEDGILASRLCDRSIRPLFPKNLHNEVQVTITTLSADPERDLEILGIIGTSAALASSGLPFEGPVAVCRVGLIDGKLVPNITKTELSESSLNLVVSNTENAIVMIEAGAEEIEEQQMIEAIELARQSNLEIISLIKEFVDKAGNNDKLELKSDDQADKINSEINDFIAKKLEDALNTPGLKLDSNPGVKKVKTEMIEHFSSKYSTDQLEQAFSIVLKEKFREKILVSGLRNGDRKLNQIRDISCEVGVLPRPHGSAIFQRGETQVLGIATLAPLSMKQKLDNLSDVTEKRYMHHYNFPAYSVGEVRRASSPGRREIGHGALAERALLNVLPSEEIFPYAIRVVSEVLSSNGSTSMASTCASTLSLMDAGVPIEKPVAGIAMGLIMGKDGKVAVLTDIEGIEDHLGDMDFKVAGTDIGINALQMDVKIPGLNMEILSKALEDAKVARLTILEEMIKVIAKPREGLSKYAPKMEIIKIDKTKIGTIIGSGGKTIRGLIEETGATIDVDDEGHVTIGSDDLASIKLASEKIQQMLKEIEKGDIFTGKVARKTNFGLFVSLTPGKDGLLRPEEMSSNENEPQMGDELKVVVIDVDHMGRVNLSRRQVLGEEGKAQSNSSNYQRRNTPNRFDQNKQRNFRFKDQKRNNN